MISHAENLSTPLAFLSSAFTAAFTTVHENIVFVKTELSGGHGCLMGEVVMVNLNLSV